jgi:hypothetical protein
MRTVINWPPGSESVIQDYGAKDPDQKEIITDPQYRYSRDRTSYFLLKSDKGDDIKQTYRTTLFIEKNMIHTGLVLECLDVSKFNYNELTECTDTYL